MPKVSVIIPNYNHALHLKQRIESVINQTYQDFELIILDDCSTDNSKQVIELYSSHPKVNHIIYNELNNGTFKQWEKGIAISSGEYIWIAESDDWSEVSFLESLVSLIESNSNVGICFSNSNWVDETGNIKKSLSLYENDYNRIGIEEIKGGMIQFNTIQNASSAVFKSTLLKKYIKKAVNYKACGDWRLYIDILQESNIIYNSKKLNNFRWYHNNISNSALKKGLWISEGLKIIAFSNAYKINFSIKELVQLVLVWFKKPDSFNGIKKIRFQVLTILYLSVFVGRQIGNRFLIKWKI